MVGIVTGDWTRALGGLIEIVAPIVKLAVDLVTIATGGTLAGAFLDSTNRWSLRDHARDLLNTRFAGDSDTLMAIKDAARLRRRAAVHPVGHVERA